MISPHIVRIQEWRGLTQTEVMIINCLEMRIAIMAMTTQKIQEWGNIIQTMAMTSIIQIQVAITAMRTIPMGITITLTMHPMSNMITILVDDYSKLFKGL